MRFLSEVRRGALGALAVGIAVMMGGGVSAQETIDADGGTITVSPVQHGTLALSFNGTTILVDPAPLGDQAQPTIDAIKALPAPQIVLVTDIHGDHFNVDVLSAVSGDAALVVPQAVADKLPDALKAKVTVLANGASTEVAGVSIEAVPMYNTTEDRLKFHEKGRGNGYVVTLGGKRVYIAGDTEDTAEMRALTGIDVPFLPMNLPYTMSVEQAADAVRAFKPAVVLPYHYGDSDVDRFKALVGDAADVRLLAWYPKT